MDRFREFLGENGLKYTSQRRVIASVFFESGAHLSLAELHALAKQQRAHIGFATVYRTMKLMAESGLAHEHKFAEGHVRYEPAGDHHDHLICVRCGKIVEYEDPRIEDLQDELAAAHGFRVVGHRHEIYGDCLKPNCPELGREQETNAKALKIFGLAHHG
jgi:Fur family ferric uptake transcriptional regulator